MFLLFVFEVLSGECVMAPACAWVCTLWVKILVALEKKLGEDAKFAKMPTPSCCFFEVVWETSRVLPWVAS